MDRSLTTAEAPPPARLDYPFTPPLPGRSLEVAPNLSAFQNFVSELTALPHVRNVRTALTLDLVKDEALVPLEDLPEPTAS